ncbi:MAG: ATP-binding protein [Promethearchaeota archaeon]
MSEISAKELESYERLAITLNKIPNGFPAVEDNTHLKVLQWIFTPEEAELASQIRLTGETVEELAKRLNIPVAGLADQLEVMESKGQIWAYGLGTERKYGLMPFVIGIYEEQLFRMDKEFALLIEDYFQKTRSFGAHIDINKPEFLRVIPVNRSIKSELRIHPFEEAEQMIRQAKSWGVRECICKEQQELLGNKCRYPKTVCLIFSSVENAFENSKNTQPINIEESLGILRQTEEAGLIHTTMNYQDSTNFICNCCTCCCAILRALTRWDQPLAVAKSNYVMKVDDELCVGCEACIDACQFNALEIKEEVCEVNHRCVGCGVCALKCPEGALSLVKRDPVESAEPPKSRRDWMTQRAIARQVDPSDLR